LVGGFALAVLAIIASVAVHSWTVPATPTAQKAFKNVQVLKDIPADDLVPTMQFVSGSLGVECDFCHVRNAFEKDDKEAKRTARQMMRMQLAINGRDFDARRAVTCYTCNRGQTKPVSIPSIDKEKDARVEDSYFSEAEIASLPAPPVGLPPASDVLAKYVNAIGGKTAIENISTRLEKGTVSFGAGPPLAVERISKSPGKQIFTVHLPAGESSTAFDGRTGWLSVPGSPIREMHRSDFPGALLDANLHLAVDLAGLYTTMASIDRRQMGSSEAILVLARNQGQPPVELFFDRNSGLLLRELRFAQTPLGLNPTRIDFSDYADFDGVKVPQHLIVAGPGRRLEIHFDEIKQNLPVDDALFKHH
jgi:photosynthetic reaction center cytochrome c subunit